FRIEHPVQKLRRVAIGNLEDETLPLGACRELTPREVEMLRQGTTEPKPGKRSAEGPRVARGGESGSTLEGRGPREPRPGRGPSSRRPGARRPDGRSS